MGLTIICILYEATSIIHETQNRFPNTNITILPQHRLAKKVLNKLYDKITHIVAYV